VVGHSDVAPNRKQDPGELFPWRRLAQEGIGLWPKQTVISSSRNPEKSIAEKLRAYGYGVPTEVDWPLPDVIAAFQRHFRPGRIDGVADAECLGIVEALLAA
jgi:N-acetylmuramoyl-L-alanine amidase